MGSHIPWDRTQHPSVPGVSDSQGGYWACHGCHMVMASLAGSPSHFPRLSEWVWVQHYLPLGRDPDGQAAVVPPPLDAQCGVVGQLHLAARVVEHVVNHPVVLDVFACGVGGRVEEVAGGQETARAAGKHTPPWEPGWAVTATCSDSEILLPL